jgi:hypothetical protein
MTWPDGYSGLSISSIFILIQAQEMKIFHFLFNLNLVCFILSKCLVLSQLRHNFSLDKIEKINDIEKYGFYELVLIFPL